MKFVYELLIKYLPYKVRKKIGQAKVLKPFRDSILRPKGVFKETFVDIEKTYANYNVKFRYFASVKDAVKARLRGVENTLIRNAITLINLHKTDQNNAVIIDVGTNFGYLSLVWSLTVCEKGEVHCFETNNSVYKSFLKSLHFNNFKNVISNFKAVGNRNESIEIFLSSTSSNLNALDSYSTKSQLDMVTLDHYLFTSSIKRCDLIKIDVDGIELEILHGSLNLLNHFKPIYVVETNNDSKIIDFFVQNKYQILDMNLNPIGERSNLPLNIFCIPN